MKIAIACDHGALNLKDKLVSHLEGQGHTVKDFGTYTAASCDYPDFVGPAAKAVAAGEFEKGIVLCTTGIGVSALLSDLMSARLTREHNDTNMMAMGAGVVGEMLALQIADTWLGTEFSQDERHQRRIAKLMALED